jgi:hypothetical protein
VRPQSIPCLGPRTKAGRIAQNTTMQTQQELHRVPPDVRRSYCTDAGSTAEPESPTTEVAAAQGPCVHVCTNAQKTPEKLPFLPLSGTPGATTRCQSSSRKLFRARHIGRVMGVPGRSESLVGIGASKLPRRIPPHVHYLEVCPAEGKPTSTPAGDGAGSVDHPPPRVRAPWIGSGASSGGNPREG